LKGEKGVIYSTDEYWYKVNSPEKPDEYSFDMKLIGKAHSWNQARAKKSMDEGHPLIIIDNTNTTAEEASPYVSHAIIKGYEVHIQEPTSERWQLISSLLNDKEANDNALRSWSEELAAGSKETHSVPEFAIERMMGRWQTDEQFRKAMGVFQ
jgi:hypothetical protein